MASWARREFIQWIGKGSVSFAFVLQIVGAVRAFVPNVLYEPTKRFKVGKPETFAEGYNFIADRRLFLVRDGNGFHAISARCTHLGCTVLWKDGDGEFDCPCHGSTFRPDGTVVGGPAPWPLAWYALSLAPDGYLEVDTSTEVREGYRFVPPKRA